MTSSSVGRALVRNTIRQDRNASMASTDVTCARCSMQSALVEVLLNALRLAQQVRGVRARKLHEFLQRFHRRLEFVSELLMLLIRPRIAQRGETRVKHAHAVFQLAVEPLQFV